MGALIRMGVLIGIGALITKAHSKGGAYSEGAPYWKEGVKSNHYGRSKHFSGRAARLASCLLILTV